MRWSRGGREGIRSSSSSRMLRAGVHDAGKMASWMAAEARGLTVCGPSEREPVVGKIRQKHNEEGIEALKTVSLVNNYVDWF